MKSTDNIEDLLTNIKDQTRPAFDAQTLEAMLAAREEAGPREPRRSWREFGRDMMHTKVTRIAAAIVVVVSMLLVGRHFLAGRPATTTPSDGQLAHDGDQPSTAPSPRGAEVAGANVTLEGLDQSELLALLSSGPLELQIRSAARLGTFGDAAAIGPLQRLADAWQGAFDRNPFREAIRQIESRFARLVSEPNVPVAPTAASPRPQETPLVKRPETGIAGVIVDKLTLEPIAGATVYLHRWDPNTFTLTNDQGHFRLVGLAPSQGGYLHFIASGYTSQRLIRRIVRDQVPDTLRIQLSRGTALCGHVRDAQGLPIMGAEVKTFYFTNVPAITDANGFYLVDGLDPVVKRYSLHVTHPDYPALSESLSPQPAGQTGVHDVVLDPGVDVYGKVTDSLGNPVSGVHVGNTRSASMWNCITAKTDAQGWYRLGNVDRGELTLWAAHPDHALFTLETVAGNAPEKTIDISLGAPRPLRGRVLDQSGEAVQGVSVSVHELNEVSNFARKRVQTDAEGRFVISNAPARGMIDLNIYGGDISSRHQMFDLSQVVDEQVISVARAGRIYGLVLDSTTDDPITDFTVKLTFSHIEKSPGGYSSSWNRQGHSFTSEQGHFDTRREDLSVGGGYRMTVLAEGYNRWTIDPVHVQATTNDPIRTVFRLSPATVVSGIVVDEAGQPVPNATVAFYCQADRVEARFWTRATTDDMGIFLVSGLGDLEIDVQVTAEGFTRLSGQRADFEEGPGQTLQIVLTQSGTLTGESER